MTRYANKTSVPEEKSRMDLERLLVRYGADQLIYGWKDGEAVVQFMFDSIPVKIRVPLPSKDDPEFTTTATGREKGDNAALKAWEQSKRTVWRAMLLIIQAKFEAILMGAATFESEFLAYMMLPGGSTIGERVIPQLSMALAQGSLPMLTDGKNRV